MEITNKEDKIALWLMSVGLVLTVTYKLYLRSSIKSAGIYSIATIDKVEAGRGNLHYDLHYFYQGQRINSHGDGDLGFEDAGKRYYVKFLKDNPDGQIILYTKAPVSDSIKEAPYEGWTTLPEYRDEPPWPY